MTNQKNTPMNPWLVSMMVVSGLSVFLGLILISNDPGPSLYGGSSGGQESAGVGFVVLGGMLLVAWFACCALTWQPEKSTLYYRAAVAADPAEED